MHFKDLIKTKMMRPVKIGILSLILIIKRFKNKGFIVLNQTFAQHKNEFL